jgi:hypothetical protein
LRLNSTGTIAGSAIHGLACRTCATRDTFNPRPPPLRYKIGAAQRLATARWFGPCSYEVAPLNFLYAGVSAGQRKFW